MICFAWWWLIVGPIGLGLLIWLFIGGFWLLSISGKTKIGRDMWNMLG